MGELPEIIIDANDISANKVEQIKKSLRDIAISKDVLIFGQFLKNVRENFWGPRISNSLTLDLFAVYLNAQKILYIESKTHCEALLNKIMLPAIFISLSASVISLGMKSSEYGSLIVAALSAFDAFLLAIISFTKLDAKAEAHKTSSYRFDKLQTKCEFYSGKVLLLEIDRPAIDVTQEVSDFIETIEKQIDDIKDSNQFVIPEKIRYRYPETYSVNIFSEVKLLRNREKLYYNKLHTIYNKLEHEKRTDTIQFLESDKEKTIVSMITLYDNYANLNNFINKEVKDYIAKSKKQRRICFWRTKKTEQKCSDGKCMPKEQSTGSWMRSSATSTRELPKDNESLESQDSKDSVVSPVKVGREWLKAIPPILRRN
jgi:hypothetical protein